MMKINKVTKSIFYAFLLLLNLTCHAQEGNKETADPTKRNATQIPQGQDKSAIETQGLAILPLDIWSVIVKKMPPHPLCSFSLITRGTAGHRDHGIFNDQSVSGGGGDFTRVSFFEYIMGIPSTFYGEFHKHLICPTIRTFFSIKTAINQVGLTDQNKITVFCNQHKNLLKPEYAQHVSEIPESSQSYWILSYLMKQDLEENKDREKGKEDQIAILPNFNMSFLMSIKKVMSESIDADEFCFPNVYTQNGLVVNKASSNARYIPIEITRFTRLASLDTTFMQLTCLPTHITQLTHLTKWVGYDNNITAIEEPLLGLTNLTYISLDKNNISKVPDKINSLINLTYLGLRDNKIDHMPETIGELISLKTFYVGGNILTHIPAQINFLCALKILDVSNNKLEKLPDEICNLIQLEALRLDGNELTNLPQNIGKLSCLTTLMLHENPKLTRLPKGVRKLSNVQYFSFKKEVEKLAEEPFQLETIKGLQTYPFESGEIEGEDSDSPPRQADIADQAGYPAD